MKSPRYIPEWPLPPYVFVPGENPHPKKKGGHMEGSGDPVCPPLDPKHPRGSRFFLYSIDLYNHGYFWESHVYFEALWNAHGRKGAVADFLKGMIKLGAAGVKLKIGQKQAALEHFLRAKELFAIVRGEEGNLFLDFDLGKILKSLEEVIGREELGHPQVTLEA